MPLPDWTLLMCPGKMRPPIRIDADVDRLTGTHVSQLRFLEIGRHPDVERYHDHDRLSGQRQLTDGRREFGDTPIGGCAQLRPLQIGVGAILLRPGLIKLRGGAEHLRVQDIDLPFGRNLGRVGGVKRRLFASEVGGGLLRALNGACALLHQILIAGVFIRCEFESAAASVTC